jgi:hypothetical protein
MGLRIDRSLRLSEGQYFPPGAPKTGIAIHHTVGGTARSTDESIQLPVPPMSTARGGKRGDAGNSCYTQGKPWEAPMPAVYDTPPADVESDLAALRVGGS